jgi:predicted permease
VNLALTVLEIVSPVFFLSLVGYLWIQFGAEYRIEFVTKLAMTLSLPCLVFSALMQTKVDPQALSALSLAAVAAYAIVTAVAFALVALTGLSQRTFLAPVIFGNTGNLGLPLALFAFGDLGLSYAIIVFAIMAIWSYTFGIWVVAGGGSPLKVIREPIVAATILGALFLWQGWQTPPFITNTLELIGQLAIPLMLITLGVAVARLSPKGMGLAIAISAVKVVICTVIGWGVGLFFDLEPVAFGVLLLQVATPVAVTSYLLAEKYGADSETVAGLVVASTLMSVIALPIILAGVL